jgi:putative copper resistance protein D
MAWYVLAVSLHLLAACVWIGGMAVLAVGVLPVLRQPPYRALAIPLVRAIGVRFRWIGWAALATLIGTGFVNLWYRGYGWRPFSTGAAWQGWFGHVLAAKLVLVALILVVAVTHDVFVGPGATRLAGEDPASAHARWFRRGAAWAGRLLLALSVGALVLGVMLVRGVP